MLSPFTLELDGFGDAHQDRLTQVAPRLYLSGRPDPTWVPELKRAGITHVVSCLDPGDEGAVAFLREDLEHLFLGVHDGMHEDIAATFPRLTEFWADARAGGVVVHCQSGVSRSPTLVIALLMTQRRQPFIDTFQAVKACRHQALPNIGFATQLQRLEHDLLPETRGQSLCSLARYLSEHCNVPADIELLQSVLEQQGYDAVSAIRTIYGGDIPRVVQGVRL